MTSGLCGPSLRRGVAKFVHHTVPGGFGLISLSHVPSKEVRHLMRCLETGRKANSSENQIEKISGLSGPIPFPST
jgi:hypothetical protein